MTKPIDLLVDRLGNLPYIDIKMDAERGGVICGKLIQFDDVEDNGKIKHIQQRRKITQWGR